MRAVPTALPVVIHLSAFRAFFASQRTVGAFPTQLKPVARFMGVFVNRILTGTAAAAVALIAALSCSDSSTGLDRFNTDSLSVDASRVVASIEVHLASSSINAGDTTRASVTMKDRRGVTINRPVQWSSSDTTIATVSDSGLVKGVAAGNVNIVARNRTVTGSAPLTVTVPTSILVASVAVALASSTLNTSQTTQATATTRDASGNVLSARTIAWSTNNSSVATVSGAGLVTAVANGSALIVATSEGKSGNAPLPVQSTPPPPPPPGGTLLFEEDFENTSIASRGWYDNTSVLLSTTEHIAGSTSSAQYHWLAGAP